MREKMSIGIRKLFRLLLIGAGICVLLAVWFGIMTWLGFGQIIG